MIQSFGDRATEDLFHGKNSARARRIPASIVDAALLKLEMPRRAVLAADRALHLTEGDEAKGW